MLNGNIKYICFTHRYVPALRVLRQNSMILNFPQTDPSKLASRLYEVRVLYRGSYMSAHVFMPPKELWEAYSNRTVRPSVSPSVRPSVRPSRFRVRSISPIFFEVGIPNLVCGYILGWRSVAYHFRVTVTLTLT